MNVLDELDAICSEKLLSLEKEFDSLVAHADFDLFDPTSFNEQPQNSAFTSSASESSVCIPELQPNPSLQGCSRFTAPKSDEEVTATLAGRTLKEQPIGLLTSGSSGLLIGGKYVILTIVLLTCTCALIQSMTNGSANLC